MRVPAICPLLSCWPVPSGALLISLACTRACTLRRRIAIPALACSSALHSYWHARAGAAAAVQLLRSHTPQPAHGALAMVVLFRAKNGSCMHACTLRRRNAVPALACSSALRSYLLACTRTRVPPPHCSSCARMLLSPPMAYMTLLLLNPEGTSSPPRVSGRLLLNVAVCNRVPVLH